MVGSSTSNKQTKKSQSERWNTMLFSRSAAVWAKKWALTEKNPQKLPQEQTPKSQNVQNHWLHAGPFYSYHQGFVELYTSELACWNTAWERRKKKSCEVGGGAIKVFKRDLYLGVWNQSLKWKQMGLYSGILSTWSICLLFALLWVSWACSKTL